MADNTGPGAANDPPEPPSQSAVDTNSGIANKPEPETEDIARDWCVPRDRRFMWAENFHDFVISSLISQWRYKLTKEQEETIVGWVRAEIAMGRQPSRGELVVVALEVRFSEENLAASQLDWATNLARCIELSPGDMEPYMGALTRMTVEKIISLKLPCTLPIFPEGWRGTSNCK